MMLKKFTKILSIRKEHTNENKCSLGAYEVFRSQQNIQLAIFASGSEVNLALGVCHKLAMDNIYAKVISVPSQEVFEQQAETYKNDILNEWSSVVGLSYIAAQRTFPFYSDMAEAKSLLESITRSYGYRLGKKSKTRVNTVSQSPTITTAGAGIEGFNAFYNYAEKMSPLGNATAEECANYCVFLFSDMSKKITMQNLFHDGGFSNTGISEEIIDQFK